MELSFDVNNGKLVFDEDGNGARVGWMKASKFPWHAALFSGSALRCGLNYVLSSNRSNIMGDLSRSVHNIMGDARNQPEFSYFS